MADAQVDVGAGKAHHVKVTHVFGQIAHELGKVGARFNKLGRPIEAGRGVAAGNIVNYLGDLRGIHRTQHALGRFDGDRVVAEGNKLLKRGERVAHPALGAIRDELQCLGLEVDPFLTANRAQTCDDRLVGYAMEVEALASGMNGFGDLLRVGGAHDEHHVAGRLFQSFQQRVERRRGKHVNLVDDVDLVTATRGSELNAPDDFLTNVVDAGTACRVELVHVGVHAVGDVQAILAGAVGLGRRTLLAKQRLCKQARRGGFTRASRAGEQVGMAGFIVLDGVANGALDMLLAHHVAENLGAIFTIKCLGHMPFAFR